MQEISPQENKPPKNRFRKPIQQENPEDKNGEGLININRRDVLFGAAVLALAGAAAIHEPKKITSILDSLKNFFRNTKDQDEKLEDYEPPADSPEFLTKNEALAHEVLEKYHEIYQKEGFLPREVFTKNFMIATQLQESNYKPKAESDKGAVGIMQTTPIAIRDVVRFLNILELRGTIDFKGPKAKEITDKDMNEIMELIKNNADYGRAFGKIYLACLYKNYGIGADEYRTKGDAKGAQKKLLAAYNGGPKIPEKKESRWPEETQDYCRRILKYMDYLEILQKGIKEKEIKSNQDYLSMRLVQVMNLYDKIDPDDQAFHRLLDGYVSEIKNMEDAKHRELDYPEIDNLLEILKSKFIDDYVRQIKNNQNQTKKIQELKPRGLKKIFKGKA